MTSQRVRGTGSALRGPAYRHLRGVYPARRSVPTPSPTPDRVRACTVNASAIAPSPWQGEGRDGVVRLNELMQQFKRTPPTLTLPLQGGGDIGEAHMQTRLPSHEAAMPALVPSRFGAAGGASSETDQGQNLFEPRRGELFWTPFRKTLRRAPAGRPRRGSGTAWRRKRRHGRSPQAKKGTSAWPQPAGRERNIRMAAARRWKSNARMITSRCKTAQPAPFPSPFAATRFARNFFNRQ